MAQAHANAASPHTPREHRRDREGQRRTSRQTPDATVNSPAAAHVRSRRPPGERTSSSRDIGSVQPLAPTSRRASNQPRESSLGLSGHPYASAPSPSGYRASPGYAPGGRHSPAHAPGLTPVNGNGAIPSHNGSDAYLYGAKAGSRDALTPGGTQVAPAPVRGMAVYDSSQQMSRGGAQDGDHTRKKGGFLCCR